MRFWDSSAVVPILLDESTTVAVRQLLAQDPDILIWWATVVECASAISRLERMGLVEPGTVREAFRRLELFRKAWSEIAPTDNIRDLSIRLLRVHDLRAADSMQLAAALIATEGRPAGFPFVCLDARLGRAAEKEGFALITAE